MRQKIRSFLFLFENFPLGWSHRFLPEEAPAMDHKTKAICMCLVLVFVVLVMMIKR